jgi:hypothetical protein
MLTEYDMRHGGPYDRGSADCYYTRGCDPHYYKFGTYTSERVTNLTEAETAAYMAGYEDAMRDGARKDWD